MNILGRYLPIGGNKQFVDRAVALALGDGNPVLADGRVAALQSLSGTGACRVMAEFMARFMRGALAMHGAGLVWVHVSGRLLEQTERGVGGSGWIAVWHCPSSGFGAWVGA